MLSDVSDDDSTAAYENQDEVAGFSDDTHPFSQNELNDLVRDLNLSKALHVPIRSLISQTQDFKYPCFLCMWDSRDRSRHYTKKDWPARDELVSGKSETLLTILW